ncbi:MAG TPA: hypothetical protein VF510_05205 [Ktedonobacterales bacterium]
MALTVRCGEGLTIACVDEIDRTEHTGLGDAAHASTALLEYVILGEASPDLLNRQFVGLPPELTGGIDQRQLMPIARVLILIQDPSGSIYLYRYAADGAFAGDTWHPDVGEAKEQAKFEYGCAVGEWLPVPADILDIEAFARFLVH